MPRSMRDSEAYAAGFRAAMTQNGLNRENVVDRAVGPMLTHLHARGYYLSDHRTDTPTRIAHSFTDGFLDEAEQQWRHG